MIHCSCGNPDCHITIRTYDKGLMLTDKHGKEHYMYFDPNSLVALIAELRETLDRHLTQATRHEP